MIAFKKLTEGKQDEINWGSLMPFYANMAQDVATQKKRIGGDFVLACAPEMEASIYGTSRTNVGIHDTAKAVDLPVWVVRARQGMFNDFTGSPTWPQLASTMPQGVDIHRPDRTHFHPFEDPEDAARIIAEAARA